MNQLFQVEFIKGYKSKATVLDDMHTITRHSRKKKVLKVVTKDAYFIDKALQK
jgi:hypothetical protein